MKRKLILGFASISIIFVISGVLIFRDLRALYLIGKLRDEQENIVNWYDQILYHIEDTQAELYERAAGYNEDMAPVAKHLRKVKEALALIMGGYVSYSDKSMCINCHSLVKTGGDGRGTVRDIRHHDEVRRALSDRILKYDVLIGRILGTQDVVITRPLAKEIARDGEEVTALVEGMRDKAFMMNARLGEYRMAEIRSARYSIGATIAASIIFFMAVVFLMIRSVTGPVNTLVRGIQNVSSGHYDAKVSIASNDEMGFIGRSFNDMTENLARMSEQKAALLTKLSEANSQLEQRVEDATEQLKMAHEKMLRGETLSAVGTFASGVAHELATPLSSVLSYFQTVKRSITPEARQFEDIAMIEKELTRCIRILRGMLDFARAPEAEKTTTNVNSIISELLALVRYQTEYKKVNIVEELDQGVPDILAVPGQLKQVFLNIILNALQAMPEGGELTVSTFSAGVGEEREVAVRVSDTGAGIADDEINKIFQPFYTTKKSGTGLGLALSYGIIKGHGGDIEVKNNAGKGTTFSVYLPVAVANSGNNAPVRDPAGIG